MALAAAGDHGRGGAPDPWLAPLGEQVNVLLADWTHHNQAIAKGGGRRHHRHHPESEPGSAVAVLLGLALSATLGLVTYRRIVRPLHGLQTSSRRSRRATSPRPWPSRAKSDETGSLARRWRSSSAASASMEDSAGSRPTPRGSAELQARRTFADLGHTCSRACAGARRWRRSGLQGRTREQRVELNASYGLGEAGGPAVVRARRRPHRPVRAGSPGHCPDRSAPGLLGISSGLGSAAPSSVVAWPLVSQGEALGRRGVRIIPSLAAKETALVRELLPIVALSMEISRNVRTRSSSSRPRSKARQARGADGGATQSQQSCSRRRRSWSRQQKELAVAKAEGRGGDGDEVDVPGNMSHEIRTPMNAIIGLSYLALKTPLTPSNATTSARSTDAGTSLLGVINDILDFSKIEAGKLDLETTDFQIDESSARSSLSPPRSPRQGLDSSPTSRARSRAPARDRSVSDRSSQLVNNAVKFTERARVGSRSVCSSARRQVELSSP